MITLINVYYEDNRHAILYELLSERTPTMSISHTGMPAYGEHVEFVESMPYQRWCFIHSSEEDAYVGTIYLSKQNEIGVFIFSKYQAKGYGKAAVQEIIAQHDGPFLANVNPRNSVSRGMFEGVGFTHIQDTLRYG